MKVLPIDPAQPGADALREAASALRRGELVVVPTETVYGLAVDPRVPGALDKLYAAKGRPSDKPVTLLAADVGQVERQGGTLGSPGRRLARRFWPGPLTLVLDTPDGFQGFRVPDYAVALALLRRAGVVLAVTSANRSGEQPALTAAAAAAALGDRVAVVLDAGPSPGGVPSTVVKIEGEKIEILREGAIPAREIWKMVNG